MKIEGSWSWMYPTDQPVFLGTVIAADDLESDHGFETILFLLRCLFYLLWHTNNVKSVSLHFQLHFLSLSDWFGIFWPKTRTPNLSFDFAFKSWFRVLLLRIQVIFIGDVGVRVLKNFFYLRGFCDILWGDVFTIYEVEWSSEDGIWLRSSLLCMYIRFRNHRFSLAKKIKKWNLWTFSLLGNHWGHLTFEFWPQYRPLTIITKCSKVNRVFTFSSFNFRCL